MLYSNWLKFAWLYRYRCRSNKIAIIYVYTMPICTPIHTLTHFSIIVQDNKMYSELKWKCPWKSKNLVFLELLFFTFRPKFWLKSYTWERFIPLFRRIAQNQFSRFQFHKYCSSGNEAAAKLKTSLISQ